MADGKIDRQTFEGMNAKSQRMVLFDYAVESSQRLERLEKKHLFDRGVSAIAGFFGGMVAVLGKMILGGDA